MIIQSSNVNLASSRQYSRTEGQRNTRTVYWGGKASVSMSTFAQSYYSKQDYYNSGSSSYDYSGRNDDDSFPDDMFTYSRNGRLMDANGKSDDNSIGGTTTADKMTDITGLQNNYTSTVFMSLLRLIEQLRKGIFSMYNGTSQSSLTSDGGLDVSSGSLWNSRFTIKNTSTYFFEESESTTFSGSGTAITADGRQVSFGVDFTMSRSYMEAVGIESTVSYPYVLTDPLVINLKNSTVDITDQSFYFDLNCDGTKENIAQLGAGSGYLVFDKNGDGIINDGSEMFGAKTGNGFKELAEYDSDHNGWIDEADEIYSKLKVWVKNEKGEDVLMSLKDADVGAIYLGSSKTDFTVKEQDTDKPIAMVRSSGMFLHENGTAGTVNQVDF